MSEYVLGIDASTQSISAVLYGADGPIAEKSLNYDQALPQYGTSGGVLPHENPQLVHAPPLMWVEALDQLLLSVKEWPLAEVVAIAGAAQQHGSVYLNGSFEKILSGLSADAPLHQQLAACFSRETSPVWMDSSTRVQCQRLESSVGGADRLRAITGSNASERFTGPQIARFADEEPEAYAQTQAIRLISSFHASLLLGKLAPTDYGDASGSNCFDVKNRCWHQPLLESCAPQLGQRLGRCVAPRTVLGVIHPYAVARFGFSSSCTICAWTGDNPASLVGLGLEKSGDCALSLGTSDTFFATLEEMPRSLESQGHVFVSGHNKPMLLQCYANGSRTREAMRERWAYTWDDYNTVVAATPVGNNGALLASWIVPEITPYIPQPCERSQGLERHASAGHWCRALLEGQMLSRRLHAESLGLEPKRLLITGGAAVNPVIRQIIADVFGVPVTYSASTLGSVALGAARMAWAQIGKPVVAVQGSEQVILPNKKHTETYTQMLASYRSLEQSC